MLLTVFMVAGILNILANQVNYNVQANKPDFEIRVRRDTADLNAVDNIEAPLELRENKRNLIDILRGVGKEKDHRNSRSKRSDYQPSYVQPDDRVNGITYGQKSKKRNFLTSLVSSLNIFDKSRTRTHTNYYPQGTNVYSDQNPNSNNFYNPSKTNQINWNTQNQNTVPNWNYLNNNYNYNDRTTQLNGNVYNGYPNNGNTGYIQGYNGYVSGYNQHGYIANPAMNTQFSNKQFTVSPFNGVSSSNGIIATTTTKMNIAEGCVLCASIGCAKNQKRVGFKCVDILDYDYQ